MRRGIGLAAGVLLATAVLTAPANAGYYRYDVNLHAAGTDAGWGFNPNQGSSADGHWLSCRWADPDAGCPTAQGPRAYAKAQTRIPANTSVRAQFTTLPDTTIAGGTVWYTEMQGNFNYFETNVKVSGHLPSDWNAVAVHSASTASGTARQRAVALPSGVRAFVVNMRTKQDVLPTVVSKLEHNFFVADRLAVDIHDPYAPVIQTAGGALWEPAPWRSGAISGDITASDQGLGLGNVGLVVDGAPRPAIGLGSGTGYHPGHVGEVRRELVLDTRSLSDGAHSVRARAVDASGEVTVTEPVTLLVDNTAPVLSHTGPGDSVASRRPTIAISASDPHSGLMEVGATLVRVSSPGYSKAATLTSGGGGTWVWEADAPLADGDYELRVGAANGAGLAASRVVPFRVADTAAPVIGAVRPSDGATVGESASITVDVSDAGGVGASGVLVRLDGAEQSGGFDPETGRFSVDVSGLTAGRHSVEAIVTDLSGNRATRTWSFNSTGPPQAGDPGDPGDPGGPGDFGDPGSSDDPCVIAPEICRAQVVGPAKIRLTASKRRISVRSNRRVSLALRATRGGAPVVGRRVTVKFGGKSWKVRTNARGTATIRFKTRRAGVMKLVLGEAQAKITVTVKR
jgi:hypothetical protein